MKPPTLSRASLVDAVMWILKAAGSAGGQTHARTYIYAQIYNHAYAAI